MSKERQQNMDKNRKSDARKEFEELDNAGRFAGDDAEARTARAQADEKIRRVEGAHPHQAAQPDELPRRDDEPNDQEAHRDPAQSHDYRSEAQNVDVYPESLERLSDDEKNIDHAREKAMQGIKQGRSE